MNALFSLRSIAALLGIFAVVLIGGCGGDDGDGGSEADGGAATPERSGSAGAPVEEGSIVVAALGDSISAGSPLWDPDPAVREAIGPALDQKSQYEYWASQADERLEFRNCGVFGERTDEIRVRFGECTQGADVLVVQGGINDVAQGRPVADAAEDLRAMVREGLDAGLEVTIVDVLPWNNGFPDAVEPINRLNRMIERIGREEEVPVLPFYDTLNSEEEPGTMAAGWTDDGDHPPRSSATGDSARSPSSFQPAHRLVQLADQRGHALEAALLGVGEVIARALSDDVQGSVVNDVVFHRFEVAAPPLRSNGDPSDRVAAPIEVRVVVDNGEIHRHENPRRASESLVEALDELWVEDAVSKSKHRDGHGIDPPRANTLDQSRTRKVCIEYEGGGGHAPASGSNEPIDGGLPFHAFFDAGRWKSVIGLEDFGSPVVSRYPGDLFNWPAGAAECWATSEPSWLDLDLVEPKLSCEPAPGAQDVSHLEPKARSDRRLPPTLTSIEIGPGIGISNRDQAPIPLFSGPADPDIRLRQGPLWMLVVGGINRVVDLFVGEPFAEEPANGDGFGDIREPI